MNPLLYMLSGAAALAVAYGVFIGGRKAIKAAADLTAAMASLPKLIKAISDNSEVLNRFSGELEFLRNAMLGATPNIGLENPPAPGAAPRQPLPAWPGAPPFVPVPDAAESDTEVIETTDAELVEQENLEAVRGMGFEVEPIENPPGVVRSV